MTKQNIVYILPRQKLTTKTKLYRLTPCGHHLYQNQTPQRKDGGGLARVSWLWSLLAQQNDEQHGPISICLLPVCLQSTGAPQYVTVASWTAPMHQNILIQLSPLPTISGVVTAYRKSTLICVHPMCDTVWLWMNICFGAFSHSVMYHKTITALPARTNIAQTVSSWDVCNRSVVFHPI